MISFLFPIFQLSNMMLLMQLLQSLVSSLEKKIDDAEKKYEETSKISEERLKQARDAESKVVDLNMAMLRLFYFPSHLIRAVVVFCFYYNFMLSMIYSAFFYYSALGFKRKYLQWNLR